MLSSLRRSPGFTLVEVMVAVVITGVVSVSLAQMLSVGQRSSDRNLIMTEMQQNIRVGIQSLSDDLRHVSYGKDPTQPSIFYAGPDSVEFVADLLDDNAGAERVSFFLSSDGDPDTPNPNDTILMKVVRDTMGVVLYSAPQAYGIAPGGLAFRWFNGGGAELANPVPQPELVGEVMVTLTVAASREIAGAYPQMVLSSTIYPRNLPLSPARSRPSNPGFVSLTYPNCESATLTWTTPTTNTDATALPLSEIGYFGLYFGTDPNALSMYTKLARTINQWTIPGLVDGDVYYLAVTCVSRSGVESYRCGGMADMTSALVPQIPAGLHFVTGAGANLAWSPVTLFTTGAAIATPVSYCIYRDVAAGFTATDAKRVATVISTTTWTDPATSDCNTYYYRVQAKACGNEGTGSNEVSKSLPPPPAPPTGLTAHAGTSTGSAVLVWPAFTQRTDGTTLLADDIHAYKIYASTSPSAETFLTEVDAPADSAVLTGLTPCQTWYLNMRCVDECDHDGEYLTSAAVPVTLWGDCDAAAPATPSYLTVTALDDRVRLQWPANTTDCDLAGYKIYYGATAGGPYSGTFAAQGSSPVTVTAAEATLGSVCEKELTGLGNCQVLYATVTTFDRCTPEHESTASAEGSGTTTCIACGVSDVCSSWATDQSNCAVHLELWSSSTSGETITRMTPTFTGGALVQEVWYGRPLVKIWASDGSAGGDGNVGARPSGSVLNINDSAVPYSVLHADGRPLKVVFNAAMNGVPLELRFQGSSGYCTATDTPSAALLVEGFEGTYSGWTSVGTAPSPMWSIPIGSGELAQSSTSSSNYMITKDGITGLGNLTMEAKVKVTGGSTTTGSGYRSLYLVFREQDVLNYYLFGISTLDDRVYVSRMRTGTFTTLVSIPLPMIDGQWYSLRVQVTGGPANNNIKGWIDCVQVVNYTDVSSTWSTGKVGVATRRGAGRFDDLRVYAGSVLP
jgi:prepilin-type N-terminal cleavage/methylation domain-containing protein